MDALVKLLGGEKEPQRMSTEKKKKKPKVGGKSPKRGKITKIATKEKEPTAAENIESYFKLNQDEPRMSEERPEVNVARYFNLGEKKEEPNQSTRKGKIRKLRSNYVTIKEPEEQSIQEQANSLTELFNLRDTEPQISQEVMSQGAPASVDQPASTAASSSATETKKDTPKKGKAKAATEVWDMDISDSDLGKYQIDQKHMEFTPAQVEAIEAEFDRKGIKDIDGKKDALDRGISGWKEFFGSNEFWTGMAPTLVGALMGDIGIGAGVGGEMMEQRRKHLEKLAEKSKSKDGEGVKTQLKSLYDPVSQKPVTAVYNPITEEVKVNGVVRTDLMPLNNLEMYQGKRDIQDTSAFNRGLHRSLKTDPVDGRQYWVDRITKEKTLASNMAMLSAPQKAIVSKAQSNYNKIADPAITDLRAMEQAFNNLVVNNQLGNKMAVMRFVKDVETRLSDQDRNFYIQETARLDQMAEGLRKMTENRFNPRVVGEAMQLVRTAMNKSRQRIKDARATNIGQAQALDSTLPNDILGPMPKFYNIDFSKDARVRGPKGTFDIPWEKVPEALNNKYELVRE